MANNQVEYEKAEIANLHANIDESRQIGIAISRAAKASAPLPISTKEFLKKLSVAIQKCQSIIIEHAGGDGFSNEGLHAVGLALGEIHTNMDNLILYAALHEIRSQG